MYILFALLLAVWMGAMQLRLDELTKAALAASESGDMPLAHAKLEQALAINPNRDDWQRQAARWAYWGGAPEEALSDIEKLRLNGPLSLEDRLLEGDSLAALGRREQAVQTWEEALRLHGPDASLYQRLLGAYDETGNQAEGLRILRAWLELDPDSQMSYDLALRIILDQPEAARQALKAAEVDGGERADRARKLQTAINTAMLQKDTAYQMVVIGRGLGAADEWTTARKAFEEAAALAPGYGEAWAFLAEAKTRLGEDGLQEIRQALELAPESFWVLYLGSGVYQKAGQVEQAQGCFEGLARLEPERALWQVKIGEMLAQKGDLDGARARIEEAIRIEPQNAIGWRALARHVLNYEQNASGEALEAARKALLLGPDEAVNLDLMGEVMLMDGDILSAERFVRQALEKDENLGAAHLHLGMIHLERGETASAAAELRKAARLADDEAVRSLAERILSRLSP
ncbi:MAG TPA: tetratricopeptide repeat protein [Anaerolineaceae bacterium]|nr:tetratricopeptide repeat protein [Anaerolineaceae bacterium]HPN50614.1 tetratricopeptide repeat protein [Anaerolineaceae bacterium]